MLRVFDSDNKNIRVFDDYDAFLSFITDLENQKLLENHPSFGKGYWAFAEYSSEKLKHVCAWIKPGFLTAVQVKALEQKLGLIEICYGNSGGLEEIPVTSEVDVEEFRKKFCMDYCRQHEWRLIETQGYKYSPNSHVKRCRYAVHPYTQKMRLSQRNLDTRQGRHLKAELDCCIDRLRQNPTAANSVPGSLRLNTQKGEF